MKSIRAFVAINLTVPVVRRVAEAERALRARCAEDGWDVKWVAPPNLHVVLRYLGEVGVALRASFGEALGSRLRPLAPFPLRARGVEVCAVEGAPTKIVAVLEDPEGGLPGLRQAVQAGLEDVGFAPEGSAARLHLVLGRVRAAGPTALEELVAEVGGHDFGESLIGEVVVYRSDATVPGEEHPDLVRVRLAGRREAPVAAPPSAETAGGAGTAGTAAVEDEPGGDPGPRGDGGAEKATADPGPPAAGAGPVEEQREASPSEEA